MSDQAAFRRKSMQAHQHWTKCVCERWCVKDGVWKMVCERWCVKDGVWKMVCERWCVKDWCVTKWDRPDRVGVPPFFKGGVASSRESFFEGKSSVRGSPPPRRRRGGGGFLKEGGGFFLKGGGFFFPLSLSLLLSVSISSCPGTWNALRGGAAPRAPHPLFLIHLLLRILPPRPAPLPPPPPLLLLLPEAPPPS